MRWKVLATLIETSVQYSFGPFCNIDKAEDCLVALAKSGKFGNAKLERYFE